MAKYLDNDGVLYLWNKVKALFNKGITGLKVSGRTITYTKGDGSTGTITTQDTTYGVVSKTANGLAPMLPNESTTTKYLRQDGSWVVPPNTTYSNMTGATSSAAGKAGLVPAPAAGKQTSFLRGDGTWVIPTDTKYNVATQSANVLMSSNDKTKLDGIASGAEVNQNAFSTITVGTESIVADSKTDTLNIVFGEYMLIEATPSEDKLTFNVVVDSSLSASSTKPISNKTVYNALLEKVDIEDIEDMQSQINSAQSTASQAYNAVGDLETNVIQNYAKKSDITNMYKYKGSVTNSSNLPTTGQVVGDTYNIVNASTYGPAGTNVSWDGSKWDALGGLFEIESITNAELDEICV